MVCSVGYYGFLLDSLNGRINFESDFVPGTKLSGGDTELIKTCLSPNDCEI